MKKENDLFHCEESFIDCTGTVLDFMLSEVTRDLDGFLVEATELKEGDGTYHFEAWSVSLGDALGRLRKKIKLGISTKYLAAPPNGDLEMTHDRLKGRITNDGVIVDGKHVDWDTFISLLTICEDFEFDLLISDPSK